MGRVVPHRAAAGLLSGLAVALLAATLAWVGPHHSAVMPPTAGPVTGDSTVPTSPGPRGTVTLAFTGDLHFQLHLAALLDHPRGALGPITRTLKAADLTMVNLESSITDRGVRVQRTSRSAPRPRRSTSWAGQGRFGHDGEQSRCGLRAAGPGGHTPGR